ncbi:hypothetical protein N9118_08775 [Akkermansiaceae bacterium]|jgi:hypothetical protein|nr:hypothetical protein [Akkermansiaceae bacterium]
MTLEFLVGSGMLLFFFGVSITLVVLKGVMVARNEFQDGQYGDSKLEDLEDLEDPEDPEDPKE